ncbi:hypothetical protein [Trinickia violacea]|uniref:hypothetical protein n=1 Tax=Trinickia violacea TaxID=2571746 RepID=UPI0015863F78|nr:hypothetical protein [Trinickia violacea]
MSPVVFYLLLYADKIFANGQKESVRQGTKKASEDPMVRANPGERISAALGVLPVPSTPLVLFVVIASVVPRIAPALGSALIVVPI